MVFDLKAPKRRLRVGGKARYLRFLQKLGYPLPTTFVIPWDVHSKFLDNDPELSEKLRNELGERLDENSFYAVRSSANVEDSAMHSFAGQFTTLLDIRGVDELVQAVQEVWRSARTPAVRAYANKVGIPVDDLKMGVIIQKMVRPVFSGISFSKNPVTGMDEVVVEAVSGLGTNLARDGVKPWRWVYKWGKWIEVPEQSQVDEMILGLVVDQTKSIEKAFGQPVDLEWVFDGSTLYWVQLRPITAIEQPVIYSNRISREVLPGIIKPLVWSVNVPLVNGAWIKLFTELIGRNNLQPDQLSKAFYYRAYFNMGAIGQIFDALGMPKETLEVLMGVEGGDQRPRFKPSLRALRHLPRMVRFVVSKLCYGRNIERLLTEMRKTYQRIASRSLNLLNERQLLTHIDDLYTFSQKAAYANIVGPLLMYVYNGILKRTLASLGIEMEHLDLTAGATEWREYDPSFHLGQLNSQFLELDTDVQSKIRASSYEQFGQLKDIDEFQDLVAAFIARFGHLSDSGNDFSRVPWREQPEFVLSMMVDSSATQKAGNKLIWEQLPVRGLRRYRLRFLYKLASRFCLYREAIGFHYTFGYGQFRRYFLALGKRFVARGVLENAADIFYLYWAEVRSLTTETDSVDWAKEMVSERKKLIDACEEAVLPELIYGDQPPPLDCTVAGAAELQGIPTSRGYYRGSVRVIRSVQEFGRMEEGAVAVIPYSDVSWSPLIARAGAVVSESGGILSHSSVIAREYNLPAVVSVTNACRVLADDMIVTVDGFKGEVILHDEA
jgi:pyruvate,water dikinase